MSGKYLCEFCEREFRSRRVVRVVQKEFHTFCSMGCFVLWRYDRPRSQGNRFYEKHTVAIPGEKLEAVLREE